MSGGGYNGVSGGGYNVVSMGIGWIIKLQDLWHCLTTNFLKFCFGLDFVQVCSVIGRFGLDFVQVCM